MKNENKCVTFVTFSDIRYENSISIWKSGDSNLLSETCYFCYLLVDVENK